jgi:poly(A) polymerase
VAVGGFTRPAGFVAGVASRTSTEAVAHTALPLGEDFERLPMSDNVRPDRARRFALWIVQKLHDAGFEALWAGGCVRDELAGLVPNDYDVATNATPEEVRSCFGKRRTLVIGAAFGVVTVVGGRDEGQIEVATFRCDAAYSDGRRPDSVSFSTAREDALRRDFTVNGMFFDPLTHEVIDYVGGRMDLEAGIVRAIGNPLERFAEDKLRMLRAARLASTFGFRVDPDTLAAVREQAATITIVSAERIATEMRKILVHPHRAQGARLLQEMCLLEALVPESRVLWDDHIAAAPPPTGYVEPQPPWQITLRILDALEQPTFRVALAAFLWDLHVRDPQPPGVVGEICDRWRLSNDERQGAAWLLTHEPLVRRASTLPWPRLQRILIAEAVNELLQLADAVAREVDGHTREIDYCRAKLQLPPDVLNPRMLISGDDLRAEGYRAGPRFREVLTQIRDAQLEAQISSRDEALALARLLLGPVE